MPSCTRPHSTSAIPSCASPTASRSATPSSRPSRAASRASSAARTGSATTLSANEHSLSASQPWSADSGSGSSSRCARRSQPEADGVLAAELAVVARQPRGDAAGAARLLALAVAAVGLLAGAQRGRLVGEPPRGPAEPLPRLGRRLGGDGRLERGARPRPVATRERGFPVGEGRGRGRRRAGRGGRRGRARRRPGRGDRFDWGRQVHGATLAPAGPAGQCGQP